MVGDFFVVVLGIIPLVFVSVLVVEDFFLLVEDFFVVVFRSVPMVFVFVPTEKVFGRGKKKPPSSGSFFGLGSKEVLRAVRAVPKPQQRRQSRAHAKC